MYNLKLGKKLQPARKVWKGFTSKLQAKLHKLKPSKAIKNTTLKLNTTVLSLLGRPSQSSNRLRRKKQPSGRPLTALRTHHRHDHHRQIRSNFDPVYIEELFNEPVSTHGKAIKRPVRGKAGEKGASSGTSNEPGSVALVPCEEHMKDMELQTSNEGEKGTPSGAPELSEVDERAERFIAEFRREMSLQRQRSFTEYQEMLQRGVM